MASLLKGYCHTIIHGVTKVFDHFEFCSQFDYNRSISCLFRIKEIELITNCLVDSIFDLSFFSGRKAWSAVFFVSKMAAATRTFSSRESYSKILEIQERTELFSLCEEGWGIPTLAKRFKCSQG